MTLDDLLATREIDDYRAMRAVRAQIKRRILGSPEFRTWLATTEPGQSADAGTSEDELYRAISAATDLAWNPARMLLELIVSALIRRLHHSGAVYLVSVFPEAIQRNLVEVTHGPDRMFQIDDLLQEVEREFGLSQAEAQLCLTRACRALEEWIGFRRFAHIKAQLPEEMRKLFSIHQDLQQQFAS